MTRGLFGTMLERAERLEAIGLKPAARPPHSTSDARLKNDPNTVVGNPKCDGSTTATDFTLQELVAHFTIPEVPDVATMDPAEYGRNLEALDGLEAVLRSFRPETASSQ